MRHFLRIVLLHTALCCSLTLSLSHSSLLSSNFKHSSSTKNSENKSILRRESRPTYLNCDGHQVDILEMLWDRTNAILSRAGIAAGLIRRGTAGEDDQTSFLRNFGAFRRRTNLWSISDRLVSLNRHHAVLACDFKPRHCANAQVWYDRDGPRYVAASGYIDLQRRPLTYMITLVCYVISVLLQVLKAFNNILTSISVHHSGVTP